MLLRDGTEAPILAKLLRIPGIRSWHGTGFGRILIHYFKVCAHSYWVEVKALDQVAAGCADIRDIQYKSKWQLRLNSETIIGSPRNLTVGINGREAVRSKIASACGQARGQTV